MKTTRAFTDEKSLIINDRTESKLRFFSNDKRSSLWLSVFFSFSFQVLDALDLNIFCQAKQLALVE